MEGELKSVYSSGMGSCWADSGTKAWLEPEVYFTPPVCPANPQALSGDDRRTWEREASYSDPL